MAVDQSLSLYLHPLSSYCQKAVTAFYENGTPFETKMLDHTEPVAGEFAALWPIRKFPILTSGDRMIIEATIIIEYLDVHHPGATRFIPEDRDAAIEVRMLDRFFDNYINTPVPKIVGEAIRQDGGSDPQGVEAAKRQLDAAYDFLERWTQDREWAAAGQFSLADCAAAPALLYADWVHPIPRSCSNVWAYRDRLLARPSYARALDEARPYRRFFPLPIPDGRD